MADKPEELTEEEIEATVEKEARQGCEYGTYCDGEDKIFYPKERRNEPKIYQEEETRRVN